LSVLAALTLVLGERHVLKPCFLHACTLCPDGDSRIAFQLTLSTGSFGRS
jgi:hypothetical protein